MKIDKSDIMLDVRFKKARCMMIIAKERAALEVLRSTGVDILEAALIAKEALAAARGQLKRAKLCLQLGAEELAKRERTVSFAKAVEAALAARKGRRARTQTDFRYVCKRLMTRNPELGNRRVRSMTARECERYLATAFETPQQFRKGRAVMSGVFSTAIRNEWCDVNPVAKVAVPSVQEHEVGILKPAEIETLLETAATYEDGACLPAVGLMLYAGVRPHEVTRLTYNDVDWENGSITIRARHSKTGGARRVDMSPPLRRLLSEFRSKPRHESVCPKKWARHWAKLHTLAGWNDEKPWQPDILRHTFASYHLQYHHDYTALQWAMGHRDSSLLRTRYVDLRDVADAARFWD